MKIAAIAGTVLKSEILSVEIPSGWEWVWAENVDELELHPDARLYIDLDFIPDPIRIARLSRLLPAAPVLINSTVHTLQEIGQPFIRINAWPGFLARKVHELAVADERTGGQIGAIYKELGWLYRIVPDIPGMISGRILAAIINEAYYTLQAAVSTKEEIDTAMKLGTNYPSGPFEWSERIGLEKIKELLTVLCVKDTRYIPAGIITQSLKKD